ncbi:MAG: protein jag [Clostridiales bacterium]|nr:protein jag [Clostridiales bacterium]
MEFVEFRGKTVNDALTEATVTLGVASSDLEYEVLEKGSDGFFGIGRKPAVIRAKVKKTFVDTVREFAENLFRAMGVDAKVDIQYDEQSHNMDMNLIGDDMGILIGKRGQTLDSLQYLLSLYINKESDTYIRFKLDTENYRERRKKTLENLAKNIAFKVKRMRKPVALEPMNPYERRVIHSALQNDRYVCTKSEGEEPYRKVVIMLKK